MLYASKSIFVRGQRRQFVIQRVHITTKCIAPRTKIELYAVLLLQDGAILILTFGEKIHKELSLMLAINSINFQNAASSLFFFIIMDRKIRVKIVEQLLCGNRICVGDADSLHSYMNG